MKFRRNFIVVLLVDILLIAASLYAAHMIRFDLEPWGRQGQLFLRTLPLVILTKLVLFYFFDLYHGMW
ncbi:MAG: polysaccharide biosynthesis protein, partial [Desulfobacteraceae bacterium]|nr:polysaccharide biosynthesis protein [Desulfobacteraceae bacterium]